MEWRRQGAGLTDVLWVMFAVEHMGGGLLGVGMLAFTDGVVTGLLEQSQQLSSRRLASCEALAVLRQ
jgi:hypothetical protein